MSRLRFGESCAEKLAGYLDQITDLDQIVRIGEWLTESADQESFLSQVKTQVEGS